MVTLALCFRAWTTPGKQLLSSEIVENQFATPGSNRADL